MATTSPTTIMCDPMTAAERAAVAASVRRTLRFIEDRARLVSPATQHRVTGRLRALIAELEQTA